MIELEVAGSVFNNVVNCLILPSCFLFAVTSVYKETECVVICDEIINPRFIIIESYRCFQNLF